MYFMVVNCVKSYCYSIVKINWWSNNVIDKVSKRSFENTESARDYKVLIGKSDPNIEHRLKEIICNFLNQIIVNKI